MSYDICRCIHVLQILQCISKCHVTVMTARLHSFLHSTIHNQKPLVIYALKINAHQFETRCNQGMWAVWVIVAMETSGSMVLPPPTHSFPLTAKSGASPTFSTNNGSSASKPSRMPSAVPQALPAAPPFRPQMPLPGLGKLIPSSYTVWVHCG